MSIETTNRILLDPKQPYKRIRLVDLPAGHAFTRDEGEAATTVFIRTDETNAAAVAAGGMVTVPPADRRMEILCIDANSGCIWRFGPGLMVVPCDSLHVFHRLMQEAT